MSSAVSATSDKRAASPGYKWAVVGMLWFICFFNYADRQAIFSIFPILESEFGFNKAQLGWIGAAFQWVYALTSPLAGQVGDHWSRKAVILGGLYVWSIITGFTAACSRVWHFVLVRAVEGLGETFYFPASMSMISDYHSKRTRSRAMGIHQTSVYAGTIGGGAIAGWMAERYGWESPFILLAVLGIVLGLVLAAFIREPLRDEAERNERVLAAPDATADPIEGPSTEPIAPPGGPMPLTEFLGEVVRTPTLLVLLLAFIGANSVGVQLLVWLPTFLHDKHGLNLAQAGLAATLFVQVGSMVGSIVGGWLADQWSRRRHGGRVFVQSMGTLLGAPMLVLLGQADSFVLLMVAMFSFGFFKGWYDANIWPAMYDVVAPSRRGTTLGIGNCLGWFGSAVLTVVIGQLAVRGVSMSSSLAALGGIYSAIACLLFFAAFFFVAQDRHRSERIGR